MIIVCVIKPFVFTAMSVMGMTELEQSNVLRVVAGVLHLGNVLFREHGNYSEVQDENSE